MTTPPAKTALGEFFTAIQSRPQPAIIYHYTSASGLMGIVESGTIWATDIQYLNDSREFEYTVTLADTNLTNYRVAASQDDVPLYDECLQSLSFAANGIQLFATAFSAKPDLLSQWRAYCPPTGGFALGFAPASLQRDAGVFLLPCLYDRDQQQLLFNRVLTFLLQEWRASPESRGSHDGYGLDFLNAFLLMAATFKHASFAEEDEWRLVQWQSRVGMGFPEFRTGRGGIVPYIRLPLQQKGQPLQLPDVFVGPGPHARLAASAVVGYLQSKNVQFPNVNVSSTPYRPW